MALTEKERELFYNNYDLVRKVIKKYRLNSADEYDDLFQEGCFGLLKAICKYKNDRNTKFSTFAYKCIDNEIRMYLRRRKRFFRDVCMRLEDEFEVDSNGSHNKSISVCDRVSGDDYNPEELFSSKEEKECLRKILAGLSEMEKDILFSFYGIGGREKLKQVEIAEKYNITQGRISIKIKKIITQLQNELDSANGSTSHK
ncbi:MAG: sigma-70 family RNA polymerase sigma factor [Thermoanaerobacteraceae bacterium]|nr:sigma-70 family RNA polymerase sigma factor [Thermoanaerobacteraceae bacterium]